MSFCQSFLMTFCQSFLVSFLKAFFLGRIQGIKDIPVGIDAVFVLLQLEGGELGNLRLLEYAGEDAFLQGSGTRHEAGEVIQQVYPLLHHRVELRLLQPELGNL